MGNCCSRNGWERCFRLAFALKNKYYEELRRMTADRDSECRWACQYKAERDELQRKLDAVECELDGIKTQAQQHDEWSRTP